MRLPGQNDLPRSGRICAERPPVSGEKVREAPWKSTLLRRGGNDGLPDQVIRLESTATPVGKVSCTVDAKAVALAGAV